MRAGLSTIQQTLTPEAASVLNHSISEASKRNHGQTTPLHVAATLLASPSGFLRQACIRSHPNSSHPLQCRALELCFSVALERLPTAQNMPAGTEPPISNALMAALKRAQAHQRRGCPEQQQQPLLAVKVELEQLIISILDDPSVSRVMREASFSSPAVKATIEQSLNSSNSQHRNPPNSVNLGPFSGIGSRMLSGNPCQLPSPSPSPGGGGSAPLLANRNMYLNPRLQPGGSGPVLNQRGEEVKKVVDILSRAKKMNPILVGEGEPVFVVKEFFRRIENRELGEAFLKDVQVVPVGNELISDKNRILTKIKELGDLIESRIVNGGVILDLGDLKWLVEQPVSLGGVGNGGAQQQQMVTEAGRAVVAEMGKLLGRFMAADGGKVWLIGTATCETYLRCQVYHSTMENDWDLQAVPIASKSPAQGMFPRLGTERTSINPIGSLSPLKSSPTPMPVFTRPIPQHLDPVQRKSCPLCSKNCEEETARLAMVFADSPAENKSESAGSTLPQWLQSAKETKTSDQSMSKERELLLKQKTVELEKKWSDVCLRLHPNFHRPERTASPAPPMAALYNPKERTASPTSSAPPMTSLYNPNLLLRQPVQPKLQTARNLGDMLKLSSNLASSKPAEHIAGAPTSPVRTDLMLGRKPNDQTTLEKPKEESVKDLLSCISSEPQSKLLDKFASALDADTFKRLLEGLMEKAWWQQEAASAVASAVTRCRSGNSKRRAGGTKGDIWLLFAGPDRTGKRKMAAVLSDQMCGMSPVTIRLGSKRDDGGQLETNFRGKTAIDRIAEAVRRNPFSVIMLEDFDEADLLVRGSIKRAMERGRLADSHGREINLGNVIFIVTGNWSSVTTESFDSGRLNDEKNGNLKLIVTGKSSKRRASWFLGEDRSTKPRKETSSLSFDLNLAADAEDDRADRSNNSSDLTVDHDEDPHHQDTQFTITSIPHDLIGSVDEAIPFKPVNPGFVRREIKKTIAKKFSMVVDEGVAVEVEVEDDATDRILGGLWHDQTSLEEWVETILAPHFDDLRPRLASVDEGTIVRLQLDPITDPNSLRDRERLPVVTVDGVEIRV